jgi:hypothetical protein
MQRFVAELSNSIEREDFEKSWRTDQPLDAKPSVEFSFTGRRVSAVVDSDVAAPWASVSFHSAFSAAIRRVDTGCNVRWL